MSITQQFYNVWGGYLSQFLDLSIHPTLVINSDVYLDNEMLSGLISREKNGALPSIAKMSFDSKTGNRLSDFNR